MSQQLAVRLVSPAPLSRAREGTSVAEHILQQLESEGVDTVFGIPGGNISPFLGVLRKHERMRFVIACHEGGAAFMADGYARSGGGVGVCLVTAGPGATNALTGVAAAHLDGVPLMVISGQVPTDRFGMGAMQESTEEGGINLVELFRHATSYSTGIVDPRSFPRLFSRALNVARTAPRGAVHLSVPANVARQPVPADDAVFAEWPRRRGNAPAVVTDEVRETFALLADAERPLVYLGGGARDAMAEHGDAFAAMAETLGIPVVTSLRGKGTFPEDAETSLGVVGMGGSPRAEAWLAEGVDVLVVVGSRLGEWASNSFSRHLRGSRAVVQVDLNPAVIGSLVVPQLPVVADAAAFLGGLVECARTGRAPDPARVALRRSAIMRLRSDVPSVSEPSKLVCQSSPLKPQRVMAELNPSLRGEADLYVDIGNCTGWSAHCLRISPPARAFYATGLTSMGWSCGAVIGGKLASPDRAAIALVGDGAFLMNGTEVNTAARYGVGVVYVVLNDDKLGMVNHGEHAQTRMPLDDDYYSLGGPDLVQFARSLGASAYRVDQPGQLARLLPAALSAAEAEHKPQVIVVSVDPSETPPYGDRFRAVGAAR